jgi:hypothetical protein
MSVYLILTAALAVVFSVASDAGAAPKGTYKPAAGTAGPPPPSLGDIVKALHDPDRKRRDEAEERLKDVVARGLTDVEAFDALAAATERAKTDPFPKESDPWSDRAAALIDAAASRPQSTGVPLIETHFEQLTGPAKVAAARYLLALNSPGSVDRFADLFARHADDVDWRGSLGKAIVRALPGQRLQAALVDALGKDGTAGVACAALLEAVEAGAVPDSFVSDRVAPIAAAYRTWLGKLPPPPAAGKPRPLASRWADAYRHTVEVAEYFPDLLGHAGPGAEAVLRETFAAREPRLSFFAIRSLFLLGKDVAQPELDAVAADDEMRNHLFRALDKTGRRDRFPNAFLDQPSLARSDMVSWLMFPTELGRAPDEIELMRVVDVDTGPDADGVVSVYLFRFRTLGDHWAAKNGWLAGIAGGYRKADAPTTQGLGQTFSHFEKYDAKTPEQHVKEITSTIREAWKKEAERNSNDADENRK